MFCDGLANRLYEARAARGFSMRELEQLADAAGNLVRNTEGGRSLPTLRTIEQLSKALDVSPAWLAYGQGPMDVSVRKRASTEERAQHGPR
jgi:transcriptional regulator with XRE-family HTH domain